MNLALDMTEEGWKKWLGSRPAFVGKQILHWLFNKQVIDPSKFANISKEVREDLQKDFCWQPLTIDSVVNSDDGSSKVLLKTRDDHLIEMVVMPYEKRRTLCVSSQVGCRMGCTFCQTGKMGFKRNLSAGEILAQLLLANEFLGDNHVTNVVFMGMGEPLDNFDNVVQACRVMLDERYFNLSKNRVTISTSGLVPQIIKLGEVLPVRLAISLHSVDEKKRSDMMPVNRRYPLKDLKAALIDYPASPRYGITFEYVMIDGVNDSIADAKKLVSFLHGLKAKVNLIPMTPFPNHAMMASSESNMDKFQEYLTDRSIPAPIRRSRGADVSGGCGQLAAKREDQLHMDPRKVSKERRGDTTH